MTTLVPAAPRPQSHIDVYLRVLNALMLRDMRSRFSGSYWGYLIQVVWPIVHVLAIATIMVHRGLSSPMGDSTMLFAASGLFPILAFKYISREVMKGYGVHRSLTYFPQVKGFDTIVARALVEIVSSFMGVGIVCLVLALSGIDPIPVDIVMSMTGYMAAIALGISFGIVNCGIVSFFPPWMIIYLLVAIIIYIISGVMFMPCYFPPEIYAMMKWNPFVQVVEWVRLGYEPNLPIEIDYLYVISWIAGSLFVGLLLERYVARRQRR